MREADERLKALFAADEPLATDPAFSAAVMEAVLRREFVAELALLAGAAAVGALTLWAVWPALAPAVEAVSEAVAPLAATLALAIGTIFLLRGPRRAPAPAES